MVGYGRVRHMPLPRRLHRDRLLARHGPLAHAEQGSQRWPRKTRDSRVATHDEGQTRESGNWTA